jgi:hypothetical protein
MGFSLPNNILFKNPAKTSFSGSGVATDVVGIDG